MTELLPTQADRQALSHHEQMLDAQSLCVPCKLCGGKAVIVDAGIGFGYYITCSNGSKFRASEGCLIQERRLGGWAYNVMEWWNRLHDTRSTTPVSSDGLRSLTSGEIIGMTMGPEGTPDYAEGFKAGFASAMELVNDTLKESDHG